jgi:hypothetical protein
VWGTVPPHSVVCNQHYTQAWAMLTTWRQIETNKKTYWNYQHISVYQNSYQWFPNFWIRKGVNSAILDLSLGRHKHIESSLLAQTWDYATKHEVLYQYLHNQYRIDHARLCIVHQINPKTISIPPKAHEVTSKC